MVKLTLNGQAKEIDVADDTPLLWVLRDTLGLTGTKYGCGMAQCGSCTVHLDGNPVRSCTLPVAAAAKQKITTIEGLSANGDHAFGRNRQVAIKIHVIGNAAENFDCRSF